MKRAWIIWAAFAVCASVVLAGLAWISLSALDMERGRRQSAAEAAQGERVRLALWRMDSFLTPLLVQEASRPPDAYTAFHSLPRVYMRSANQLDGEVLVPSPLLTYESPLVRLHFQVAPDGAVSSPQVPSGDQMEMAQDYVPPAAVAGRLEQLIQLKRSLRGREILASLPREPAQLPPVTRPWDASNPQYAQNNNEFRQRGMSSAINQSQNLGNGFNANATSSRVDVQPGAMKAMWVGDQLVIARAVSIGGRRHVQGAWLDWPAIRSQLLGDVADLLPRAQLVREDALSSDGTSLATLPLRLVSGPVPLPPAQASPLPMTLSLAWAGVLAGALAVGVVMQVALSLGRRREAFVSAVTHELRTPLTTFRLYTDLLAGNMVPQEEKRQAYVLRLADEAQRLSHLVENVLAYSRLSGPQGAAATEAMTLGQLVERCRERMDAWAQRAAMTLVVDGLDAAGGVRVLANPLGVEQILMNLVDNACKYAARSGDRRIHVELATQRGRGVIRIRDHGPGLPQRGLFRPFTKSASAAANSAPGVGLGLALCRRLARGMRGDLCAAPTDSGACLVLTLRLAAKFQTPNAKLQTD